MQNKKIGNRTIQDYSEIEGANIGLLNGIYEIIRKLVSDKAVKYKRVLPIGEYFIDRWEKASFLGFGDGASVYDSAMVIGEVNVGCHTWIGPNVILDGSGGLSIGSYCSISAGVQIYSHDSVKWAISGGKHDYEFAATTIGDRCYIGPNTIIQKGVTIGSGVIVGANSFVNKDIPSDSKAYGTPVKIENLSTL